MKNNFIFFLAIFAIMTVSCSKNICSDCNVKLIEVKMQAALDGSKATLNGQVVEWQDGDEIAVWDGYGIRRFSLLSKSGRTAVFVGTIAEDATAFKAVYPYSAACGFEDGTASITLPCVQNVGSEPIDPAALVSAASSNSISMMNFKNLVSLVCFRVESSNFNEAVFRTNAETALSGAFCYDFENGTITPNEGANKSVSVKTEETLIPNLNYYIAVLPTECENGVTIACANDDAVCHKRTYKPVTLPRNGGVNLSRIDDVVLCKKTITELQELKDWMGEAGKYASEEVVTLGANISVSGNLTPIDTLRCVFNGDGNSLEDWESAGTPFIKYNAGTVNNLMIGESCRLNWPSSFDFKSFGFVVCENLGTVSGCINMAPVNSAFSYASRSDENYGAVIVGTNESGSVIENCENYGDITLTVNNTFTHNTYIAPVCAHSTGSNTIVKGCRNSGNVNLNFIADFPFSFRHKWIYIAGILGSANAGVSVSDCENDGCVSVNFAANCFKTMLASGVVAYSAGPIKNCRNSGKVSYIVNGKIGATSLSGIASYQTRMISGCNNYGDITLSANSLNDNGPIGSLNGKDGITANCAVAMGGIVGYSYSKDYENRTFSMNTCNNTGKITFTFSKAEEGEYYSKLRTEIGGVIGDAMGVVTSCTNSGNITVKMLNSEGDTPFTPYNAGFKSVSNAMTHVGGVVGADYMSAGGFCSVISCSNSGTLDVTNWGATNSYSCIGGILGMASDSTGNDCNVEGCTNTGSIAVAGQTGFRIGGIAGQAKNIENDTNGGDINDIVAGGSFTRGDGSKVSIDTYLGGIVGCKDGWSFKNNRNTGKIAATSTTCMAGGLIGRLFTSRAFSSFAGCSVNCTLSVPGGSNRYGIINGAFSNKNAQTVGESGSSIKVKGTIVVGSETTILTEDNFFDKAIKTAYNYAADKHVIYAEYGE